jgi:hypothetical protein
LPSQGAKLFLDQLKNSCSIGEQVVALGGVLDRWQLMKQFLCSFPERWQELIGGRVFSLTCVAMASFLIGVQGQTSPKDPVPSTDATVVITQPADGNLLTSGTPVTIQATAIDPNGYIARVDFYDFDVQIGTSQLEFFRAPDPGTPIYHTLEWSGASLGLHQLTARTRLADGTDVVSSPVRVMIKDPDNGTSTNSAGAAQISRIIRQSNGRVALQLTGPLNALGLIETSMDLLNWTPLPPMFLPDGQIVIQENAAAGLRRFYRTISK